MTANDPLKIRKDMQEARVMLLDFTTDSNIIGKNKANCNHTIFLKISGKGMTSEADLLLSFFLSFFTYGGVDKMEKIFTNRPFSFF